MSTSGINLCVKAIQELWARKSVNISINLVGEQGNTIKTYTNSDQINGTAAITVEHDVDFDHLNITFEGVYRVYNERTGPPHTDRRIGASRTFLKMRYPLSTNIFPSPRQFKKGETYSFPFSFVVPHCIEPPVCTSKLDEAHTQLPLTLTGGSRDGFTPSICEVIYAIQVRIVNGPRRQVLAAQSKQVRVVPTNDQTHSGLGGKADVEGHQIDPHILEQVIGRFTLTASQPPPIRLLTPEYVVSKDICSIAVRVRFDSVDRVPPPRLKTLRTKLEVSTTYTCNPGIQVGCASTAGTDRFVRSIPLSSVCMRSVQWQWARRSQKDNLANDDSQHLGCAGDCYEASVVVPITLPRDKVLVPSFASCLMSRDYILKLSVSHSTSSVSPLHTTVQIDIPLKIISMVDSIETPRKWRSDERNNNEGTS
ncbi:uncharacterized protein BO95DRAFT_483369 [Aspergillus brunneoviolaceus CBS 621.78]|uniref:Uncharacterized protein n=1 Tax=Aspergillus brunneoviolaceus CBS 621.78 TaxID=1450534 RepID=A0ACD1G524_9EURO|nr:hypothetical protein BO95DRAFT_483369 [Aspergillus brunneoviolaceus CBS 621.78]RAH44253.1 hypothetical protein BO95DRAFT_483369 [Aspergillus brunneoviolaceus CBS 621.78]